MKRDFMIIISILIILLLIIVGTIILLNNKKLSAGQIVEHDKLELGEFVRYFPDKIEAIYPNLKYIGGNGKQDNLKWRILRIYENGDVDLLGDVSSCEIRFSGADDYNNIVYYLNDFCKFLYSNQKQKIYARSINYEDLEYYLSENIKSNRTEKIQTMKESSSYYPELYNYEQYSGVNSRNIRKDGIKGSEDGSKVLDLPISKGSKFAEEGLTVKQTYYPFEISEETVGKAIKVLNPRERFVYRPCK